MRAEGGIKLLSNDGQTGILSNGYASLEDKGKMNKRGKHTLLDQTLSYTLKPYFLWISAHQKLLDSVEYLLFDRYRIIY